MNNTEKLDFVHEKLCFFLDLVKLLKASEGKSMVDLDDCRVQSEVEDAMVDMRLLELYEDELYSVNPKVQDAVVQDLYDSVGLL